MPPRLKCVVLVVASAAGFGDLREEGRRFVVSQGCPQHLSAGASLRLFVAVPSAAANVRRRQWVRATWCRSAFDLAFSTRGSVSAAVTFFVGEAPELVRELSAEAEQYSDVTIAPYRDGPDNVTAKQIHSFAYFARLVPRPTHYARIEDDVYARLPEIAAELATGFVRTDRGSVELPATFAWAFFVTEGAAHPYPAGAAFFLSADLGLAIAAAHGIARLDVGRPFGGEDAIAAKAAQGKGGFHAFGWSTDDAFVGQVLRIFAHARIDDRRFHDALGRGVAGFPASEAFTLTVHGLRSWTEFRLLHRGDFDTFNRLLAEDLERLPDGTARVWMEVDGKPRAVDMSGCDDPEVYALPVCRAFALDDRVCSAIRAHFRAVCPAAAAHFEEAHATRKAAR